MERLKLAAKFAAKVARGILAERVITLLTRLVDVLMVAMLLKGYNILSVIAIITPLYFFLCVAIVSSYDWFLKKGYDLLGLDYLVNLKSQDFRRNQYLKRLGRWIMKREITIFLVGSIVQLDPDIVAILLRKNGEKGFTILFFSVFYAITFWSVIYWLGVKGYGYFRYFVE